MYGNLNYNFALFEPCHLILVPLSHGLVCCPAGISHCHCHYRPPEKKQSSIWTIDVNFAPYLPCITTWRSALSNILRVDSLPFCNLWLQLIVPANNCTKQDCSARLLIVQTAGEGLLAFLVPSSALVLLKQGEVVQGGVGVWGFASQFPFFPLWKQFLNTEK